MGVVGAFAALFAGRTDVTGGWDGQCLYQPITLDTYAKHLSGEAPIGVYPTLDNGMVAWGCVDIDFKATFKDGTPVEGRHGLQVATDVHAACDYLGIPAHIEETVNGYHVWVFSEEQWVSAVTMQRALLVACRLAEYDPKEVNPKQTSLKPGQVGNYVRLPYPGGQETRQMIDANSSAPQTPVIPLDVWVSSTISTGLAARETLEKAASHWLPARRPTPDVSQAVRNVPAVTRGLIEKVAQAPNGGRNNALNWAAHAVGTDVAEGKYSQAEAQPLLDELARVASMIGLGDSEIEKTIQSGYGSAVS